MNFFAATSSPMATRYKKCSQIMRGNFSLADNIILEYLHQNPFIVTYLKTAAGAVVIATIIEDVITAGAGIYDDWVCFSLAHKLWSIANKFK